MNSELQLQQSPRVAIVYDHLTTAHGGAELVLQTLFQLFPHAPLFTTVQNDHNTRWASTTQVNTSFLQHLPFIKYFHQLVAPLHPLAFESFDLAEFDIIISVTSGAAKGVITLPRQLHVCYLLTPTRYLLSEKLETNKYVSSQKIFSVPGLLSLVSPVFSYLKRWDVVASSRPDKIIAISQLVSNRSKIMYGRAADKIIFPPYVRSFSDDQLPNQNFLLCLTRLVSYKNLDQAILAAIQSHSRLVIAGEGPERNSLIHLAGNYGYVRAPSETLTQALTNDSLIVFLGTCIDAEKNALLANCLALVMPGEEDFGLVGLEAASFGKPVITHKNSGIAEILKDITHGIHLKRGTVAELASSFQKVRQMRFNSYKIANDVKQYESRKFSKQFATAIYHFWHQHSTISAVK